MDGSENFEDTSDYEHDVAEESQFITPKSNVSVLFSVFYILV